MKHYCIFEQRLTDEGTSKVEFVLDTNKVEEADDLCVSFNNFRKSEDVDRVRFFMRCLEQEEFEYIKNYNPFQTAVIFKTTNN